MNLGMYERSIKRLNREQLEFLRKISQKEKQKEAKILKAIYASPNGVNIYHAFDAENALDAKSIDLLTAIMEDSNWTLFEEREELFYELKKREI